MRYFRPHLVFGVLVLVWFLGAGLSLLNDNLVITATTPLLGPSLKPPSLGVLRAITSGAETSTDEGEMDDSSIPPTQREAGRAAWRGPAAWFGSDSSGRSLFYASALAPGFYVAPGVLFVGLTLGIMVSVGVLSGYVQTGPLPRVAHGLVEANHSLPQLLVIFVVLASTGWRMTWLVVALALMSGLAKSIVIRNKIESLRAMDFIEGLREMGLSPRTILFRHLIGRHCRALLIVQVPFLLAELVLLESCLGFLEHPVEAPISFGQLLGSSLGPWQRHYYWPFAGPALGIIVLVLGLYSLGLGLTRLFNERNPYSL